jgi:hypothetical protein
MSAIAALKAARAAGVHLRIEDNDLVLEASAAPPSAVLDLLSLNKVAIVTMLRSGVESWSTEDWRVFFGERAGIAEFDGGLPPTKAEALAFAACVTEWLNQHPVPSAPGRCAWCGRPESPGAMVVPFGTEPGTHTWLHAECWPDWQRARSAEAANGAAVMVGSATGADRAAGRRNECRTGYADIQRTRPPRQVGVRSLKL